MADNLFDKVYNPDVLSCLANLSNDEVFTPPDVANKMLDMLPQELFSNPNATFLDPACKSGIFLREIAKRLIKGLEKEIPDLQERLDHIFHKQLYGIAITEMTSLLSRRSVYCSKYPNSKYSVSKFDDVEGNIRYRNIAHTWVNGKCKYCGASKSEYGGAKRKGLETYAYEFIHTIKPEEILDMKFDVIISNPPYQLSLGNTEGNSSKAKAIYHQFISAAKQLNPRYISMIVPSRWMTKTTEGIPDSWVDDMLQDDRLEEMHDYANANRCFPGVEIKGGVNYFLWSRNYKGKCNYTYYFPEGDGEANRFDYLDSNKTGVVIRDPRAYEILNKIIESEKHYFEDNETNFSSLVSPKDFFTNKTLLTSSWKGWVKEKDKTHNIKYYISKSFNEVPFGYVSYEQIPKNLDSIGLHKVFIPAAGGSGTDQQVLGYPFYGEPNSVCSQTYLVIGYDAEKHNFTKEECHNIVGYIKTRFFRYLVSIKKNTQNGPRGVYQFVPLQDFTKPWTDEELYKKYNLTADEIAFIESMIKPMDLGSDVNG